MQDQIIEFANVLRRNGVRVSLSENIDAFRAIDLLGVENASQFRAALRTTLVKRTVDLRPFEELFDFFFFGIGESLNRADQQLMQQLGLSTEEFQKLLDRIDKFLKQMEGELSDLTRALLSGNKGELERLLRQAAAAEAERDFNQSSRFTPFTKIASSLELDKLQDEIERLKRHLQMLAQGGEDSEKLIRYLDQRLKDLYGMLREIIQQEQRKRGIDGSDRNQLVTLTEKSFSFYSEDDIQRMNEAVTRLAQRFKNRLSVRRKIAARGRFDLNETLRKNLQFGGVPFNIQLDRRKKTKPQVVVLCDISDSVMNASHFMLQFVYSIQDLYSKVRSFVFVSDIGEVTQLFEEHDIHKAIELALTGNVIDVYSHSNFGRAFELFYKEYFSVVTNKTTVLIIGDGRNNYNRPSEWVLREIQQKAKQLIWLNPESRMTWGVGDSEMPRYASYCKVAEECRNIGQLYKLIEAIVP
jgi:uncharacterized protein